MKKQTIVAVGIAVLQGVITFLQEVILKPKA